MDSTTMRARASLAGLLVVSASLAVWVLVRPGRLPRGPDARMAATAPHRITAEVYERHAREQFLRQHPGERPLNWAIGEAAVRFHRARPMGKFVLSLQPGKWGNDCSDFVDCAVDEGLGVKARFRRGSREHLLACDRRLWDVLDWTPGTPAQPGDLISVRHSPWYEPYEGAGGHVGIVGADGMVYDFAKLKSWPAPRYGRQPLAGFVRHSLAPGQVAIWRLAPQYRYRIEPLPAPSPRVG
jgi:hypothetical protein